MKRFNVSLADEMHDLIDAWAKRRGQPKAGLAAFLIERAIEDARDKGYITDISLEPPPQLEEEGTPILRSIVRKLVRGEKLSRSEGAAADAIADAGPNG